MKKRFFIGVIVLIILFSISSVFAATSNNIEPRQNTVENRTDNTVNSNTTNELSEEDLIPALEEELKEKQEQEREELEAQNSTNSTNTTKKDEEIIKDEDKDVKNEILSDIYIAETEENLVYRDNYIDGNVYIFSSAEVVFEDCEISGNVFIISNFFELNNTKISGSAYVMASTVNFIESEINSIYVVADDVNGDVDSVITNDMRAVANTVNFLGEIGRDSYIQVFETSNIDYSVTIQDILPDILTKFVIILIIAIIILGGFPKFVGVNLSLGISSFFKAFFTGIIEIIVILAIAIMLMVWGFGIGYAFAILILLGALLYFGKAIFIVAFGLRLVKNRGKNVRVKAFIFTIFVAAVVEAIELIMVLGETGFIVNLAINMILAITGLGTLVRVIFTAKKKRDIEEPVRKQNVVEKNTDNVVKSNDAPIEHNLKLEVENVSSDGSKKEVYEITGKIIKRKVSSEEIKQEPKVIENESEEKENIENKEEPEDKEE